MYYLHLLKHDIPRCYIFTRDDSQDEILRASNKRSRIIRVARYSKIYVPKMFENAKRFERGEGGIRNSKLDFSRTLYEIIIQQEGNDT